MDDGYIEYAFSITPLQPATDILIAQLSELKFDSFVEKETGLLAYIKKTDWKEDLLREIQVLGNSEFKISYTYKEILQQNWNAKWEKNFDPISIDGRCIVRAPFHAAVSEVAYEIVITPKMSFGTGHHETTHMMLEFVLDQVMEEQTVLDMGTGTGVLAILAAMKGASKIDAIDIDPWSFENAKENVTLNGQQHIAVYKGDASLLQNQSYHFILANINRNILLKDLPVYANHLNTNGTLILSGFYTNDLAMISQACAAVGLKFQEKKVKNNWVAAVYRIS